MAKHLPGVPIERQQAKAKKRADNKIVTAMSNRHIRYLPDEVKRRWVEAYAGDAEFAMRALLRGSSHVCDKCGCAHPNVQAVRLYCELAGAVGPLNQFVVNLNQSLGVRDEVELRSLVESGRRLERLSADSATSLEEYRESALDLLKSVLQQKPEWRNLVLARLGSHAEEASGAHTNGTEASAP